MVRSAVATGLYRSGLSGWKLAQCSRTSSAVLMYHRVLPAREMDPSVQAGMVVEPDTLNLHLQALRKRFEVVPLSDLASFMRSGVGSSPRTPSCALTFDDGWHDFYRHAYPIVKSHNAPVTVFLPTDFVGTDRWFWTDRLGYLLSRAALSRSGGNRASRSQDPLLAELLRVSGTEEARLEQAIAMLKPHGLERIERVLAELSTAMSGDRTPAGRAFLNWEEVREMADSGLVSFGSHTAGHQLLTTLADDQARHELRKSMDDLLAHGAANESFLAFSYPNGDLSERLSEMVREAGYHLAVTTRRGWHDQGANPYTINRIGMHQDVASTEAMLLSRMAGLL